MNGQTPMDRMKEAILKGYPRLGEDDTFSFSCNSSLPCFNRCCADVNIVLTPYDILRMKTRLGMTSDDFRRKHCIIPFTKQQKLPVVLLKMQDNERRSCPFVSEKGCSIYEDRPWACRMYPVGAAAPKQTTPADQPFYFLLKEDVCTGFRDGPTWTIRSWMQDQGVAQYDAMGEDFREITLHEDFLRGRSLNPKEMEQFFMVCYDLDTFRRFVFQSTFLQKFDVDPQTLQKVEKDDVELMKFGFRWLRFCLFKQPTMKIKESVREARMKEAGKKTTDPPPSPCGPRTTNGPGTTEGEGHGP